MSNLKAYEIDEEGFWAAESVDAALLMCALETSSEISYDDVRELSDAELDADFQELDENERPTGRTTTFRHALNAMTDPGFICGYL